MAHSLRDLGASTAMPDARCPSMLWAMLSGQRGVPKPCRSVFHNHILHKATAGLSNSKAQQIALLTRITVAETRTERP